MIPAQVSPEKWGIIYSPKAGSARSHRRWRQIRQALNAYGIDYDAVLAEGFGAAERLAAQMVQQGYGTLVVVGGDAALNDVVNGIMGSALPHPALGIIPNGFGNDFARYWGFRTDSVRAAVAQLIERRTRRIDVGTCRITDVHGGHHQRYFVDGVNIGLTAALVSVRRTTRRFLGRNTLASLLASLVLVFRRKSFTVAFRLTGESVRQRVTTVCVGSATAYGQTPSAVPYNGLLDISAVGDKRPFRLLRGLWLLRRGRFLAHKNLTVWRTDAIRFDDVGRAPVCLDGRVVRQTVGALDIGIKKEELDFIVPA